MASTRIRSKRLHRAATTASLVCLPASVFAGSGDVPGSGPTITGASIISGPVPIAGDTSDNTDVFDVGPLTTPPTDCGGSTAPDAWYTISIGATTGTINVDIDLCETAGGGGALYDSKIFILDATSTALQCNDETGCTPGSGPSAILNLALAPGDYELAIDGFGTASGVYSGEVRQFIPATCFLDPPCTGVPEGEICDEVNPNNQNGGCSGTGIVFPKAPIGGTVCGLNFGHNGTRDTDWWSFEVTQAGPFELEIRAEHDSVSFLAQMSAGGSCPVIGIPEGIPAFSGDCDAVHIVGTGYQLDAGFYIMFVGTGNADGSGVFDGFPCADGISTNGEYEMEIREVPPPPPPCPWDVNGNGDIDFADLLAVIGNWGPCPGNP